MTVDTKLKQAMDAADRAESAIREYQIAMQEAFVLAGDEPAKVRDLIERGIETGNREARRWNAIRDDKYTIDIAREEAQK
jgi:hypothetical protein